MKLYQPVLYVGLGGTGCDIGAELERRLREEICGPDGTAFLRRRSKAHMLPYQLPSCVQFVYADLNRAALDRMPRRVVPGSRHIPAARATAHYVQDLVPQVDSYPQLARTLRLDLPHETAYWLPPPEDEPRVNPLQRGAGQFPTVGRAALFASFADGIAAAVHDLHTAIGNLSSSGEDLQALGGQRIRAVDVFVAFSVAGGTGGGIFYDYLHLIGQMFEQSELRAKIFPLVLMPSAYDQGLGGGRIAELNAGPALLDLFKMIGSQNRGEAERYLSSHHDIEPIDPDVSAVYYPVEGRISLRPGTIHTGVLFSRPIGARREDLHRSVTSLVTSLIGTELQQEDNWQGEAPQSFADSFVNAGAHRELAARDGIGDRGVSTAFVASLAVPFDDLADIIARRLLRTAIEQMSAPIGKDESNRGHIEAFLRAAGVHRVLAGDGVSLAESGPVHGAREMAAALNDRAAAMEAGLALLEADLRRDVPQLAENFDPRSAIQDLLGNMDVFRVQRIAFGHSELNDDIDRTGAAGLLHRRRAASSVPEEQRADPSAIPRLRDRFAGLRKLKWSDREPVAIREQQDGWYRQRTQVAWAEQWDAHAAEWQVTLSSAEFELGSLAKALLDFAHREAERPAPWASELYRHRVGVSYLLPPGGSGIEQFYQLAIRRLVSSLVSDGTLLSTATEADLVQALIGANSWREAYETASDQNAGQAVADMRDLVKSRLTVFLQDTAPDRQPLLPRLHDLLAGAAGTAMESSPDDYADEFREKLANLLPAAFTPQGSGPMKVLISYPADARSPQIEAYLRDSINLPGAPGIAYEMRDTLAQSITVVLFRSSMGVTDVQEIRDVLRLWASAVAAPQQRDLLQWRQRNGFESGYLATTEENRVEILQRLLGALWNGRVQADGPVASPERIRVTLAGGVTMNLKLTPLGQASSWGSLLRSYELWTLDHSEIHRLFSAQLMHELPAGLDSKIEAPADLYHVVTDLAERQIEELDSLIENLPRHGRSRAAQMRGFWARTMPAALALPFTGLEAPTRSNLRQLGTATGDKY
jgi:hypothetical protein